MKQILTYTALAVAYCALHWCAVSSNITTRAHYDCDISTMHIAGDAGYRLYTTGHIDASGVSVDLRDTAPVLADAIAARRLAIRPYAIDNQYAVPRLPAILASLAALALGCHLILCLVRLALRCGGALAYALHTRPVATAAWSAYAILCATISAIPYGRAHFLARSLTSTIATANAIATLLLLVGLRLAIARAEALHDRELIALGNHSVGCLDLF